jgi:hypothetical protein
MRVVAAPCTTSAQWSPDQIVLGLTVRRSGQVGIRSRNLGVPRREVLLFLRPLEVDPERFLGEGALEPRAPFLGSTRNTCARMSRPAPSGGSVPQALGKVLYT